MANKVDLHKLFLGLQKVMTAELETGRESFDHPVTKGDASELNWRQALTRFLPQRYQVERATVVDSSGDKSECIDLVIFDRQYSPLLFEMNGGLYVPAESVYAAIEVKQEFTAAWVKYAGKKVESVRKLNPKVTLAAGMPRPKDPVRIIGGLVALTSTWRPPFGSSFKESLFSLKGKSQLDIGCALRDGAFDVTSQEATFVDISSKEASLVFFLLRFLQRLQDVGTVPAIDLHEYAKNSAIQIDQKKASNRPRRAKAKTK